MAITRLMHMKEHPEYKPKHLANAIRYILDVRNDGWKTDFGKWVGGNCGLEHDEVLQSFLDTKNFYGKEEGRQGYHFVISFPPGEVDAQKCYDIMRDFCDEYLQNEYDYVFAVHTDQEHMHGHIIFNSVNRQTGLKYRYKDGDWEKLIQPVTDKICKEHGVSPLLVEQAEPGMAYAKWMGQSDKKVSWTYIFRADIDYAISLAKDMDDFSRIMAKLNYQMDTDGRSSRYRGSNYITFKFTDENGRIHKKRSFSLTRGNTDDYSVQAIEKKIREKNLEKQEEPYFEKLTTLMQSKAGNTLSQMSTVMKNRQTYKRMYQAVSYYKLPNPFAVPQQNVRRDMLRIDKLLEECAYIKEHPTVTVSMMEKRYSILNEQLHDLYILRKYLRSIDENVRQRIPTFQISRYRQLQKLLLNVNEDDDSWEAVEDELSELEKVLPANFIENDTKLRRCERNIAALKKEKKILERIIQTEGGKTKALEPEINIAKGL